MASTPQSSAARAKIGRYTLFGAIASGGMAKVHIGRLTSELGFEKTVAIKRLHPQLAEDPAFVDGLLDEARIVSRIAHPSVVPMSDVVQQGEEVWLVMEYVPGESLGRLVFGAAGRGELVPVPIATAILVSVLHGLQAAHEACDEQGERLGIVHRDVSPQNVLVGSDGLARLLDFGVAKARGRLTTTGAGQVKGKISYMSPEQLLAEEVDERTDLYAAGVVLWEALTGERMFRADDEGSLIGRVLDAKIVPPSEKRSDLPAALDAIVMRALARDPKERFASAHEMAVAIEETIGVATTRQVAEWVRASAKDDLEKRAAMVASVERSSEQLQGPTSGRVSLGGSMHGPAATANDETVSEVVAAGGVPHTDPSGSQVSSLSVSSGKIMSAARPSSRRGKLLMVLALAAGGLAAVGVRFARDTPTADGAHSGSGLESRTESVGPPAPIPPPTAESATSLPPPASASASESGSPVASASPSAGAALHGGPHSSPAVPPKPPMPAWTPPPPKPDCNPPYTIGGDGIRRLKKGCN